MRARHGVGRAGKHVVLRDVYAGLRQLADDLADAFPAVLPVLGQKSLERLVSQVQVISGEVEVVVIPGADFHPGREQDAVFPAHGFGAEHAVGSVVVRQRVDAGAAFERGADHFLRRTGSVRKIGMGVQVYFRHFTRVQPQLRRGRSL